MNIKSILLTAVVASMTLVACDSSDESDVLSQDKMPKSVTITLPNITQTPGSRATGKGMEAGQIGLKNFKVFFLNGAGTCINSQVPTTDVLSGKESGLTQPDFYFSDSNVASHVGINNKITYHFLPAEVAKVVVVGNIGDKEYPEVDKEYDILNDGDSGTDVLDTDNHPYYPLYGEANLTPKNSADDKDHNNVYTASVELKPRVARLEIYGFEYTKNDPTADYTYTSIEPIKIALANYATAYNLKSGGESTTETKKRTAHNVPTDASKVWDWAVAAASPWADSFSDITNASLLGGEQKYADFSASVDANDTNGSLFTGNMITYSVADSESNKMNNPELLLTFYGVKNGVKTPLYLHGKFVGNDKSAFEAGKIYRVLFPISDGAWKNPDRCVELTVTVAEWSIEVVTPEFN